MEDRRDELQKLYFEAEHYRRHLESISGQMQLIEAARNELETAVKALDSLEEAKAGDEILVPIGSGSFIKGEIKDTENMIIGIGTEISVEKGVNEAKKILDRRKKDMLDALEKLRKNAMEMNEKLMQLNSESEKLVREIQAGEK